MAARKKVEVWRGQVRIPKSIADWVIGRSEQSSRTLNAEIVEVLREAKERAIHTQPQM